MKRSEGNDLLNELKGLVANGKIDIDYPEVTDSKLYQEIQNEVSLIIAGRNFKPEELLLIAKIVGSSPILESIEFAGTSFGIHSLAVAYALSKSTSIETIDFTCMNPSGPRNADANISAMVKCLANLKTLRKLSLCAAKLGQYGPKTAEEISKLQFLESIDLSGNCLEGFGPSIAEYLAKSETLKKVIMSGCHLGKHGPATAINLAKSKTLKKIDISWNGLEIDDYRLKTAEAFLSANSSLTVYMKERGLEPSQKAAIKNIAKTNNEQVVKNTRNTVLFLCFNNFEEVQYSLPKEIICEIVGNLNYNTLEFILDDPAPLL